MKQAKLIEYAYPSSTTATKAGYGKTGCWFVALYESDTSSKEVEKLKFFTKKQEAITFSESLPNPYHTWHKYFNL